MEEENIVELLQRYRRDRRLLLNFILSSSLIRKVVMPPGAVSLDDVDLDQVSIDYVLNCAKKGEMIELSEAIRDYHDHLIFPVASNSGLVEDFFLVTIPESSGSPPARAPPPIPASSPNLGNLSKSQSFQPPQELPIDEIDDFENEDDEEEVTHLRKSHSTYTSELSLLLPPLSTGITEDDLRETAYEILLASVGAVEGGLVVPSKEKKREKKSKLMRKLAHSQSDFVPQSEPVSGLTGLLEIMRVQLEISEAMDIRTKKGLNEALIGKVGKQMDTLLIPLELLRCISKTEFSDKKTYLRWQKRQLNMLEEGLINHPIAGIKVYGHKRSDIKTLLVKIEESELQSLPSQPGLIQRAEYLNSLRDIATSLAEKQSINDLSGDVFHWADGYHFNVKIYEKLLLSVFDILDEGKFVEEIEEILDVLKLTWRLLGITQIIHDTCYAWVLFRQFVLTGEQQFLQFCIEQLRKIPLKEHRLPQDRLHLRTLSCLVEGEGDPENFTFLQSFLFPIQKWAATQLEDYHLLLTKDSAVMEGIVTVAMVTRKIVGEEYEEKMHADFMMGGELIEAYITSSVRNAYGRILQKVESASDTAQEHPLASIAEEMKKLLKKDSTFFMPVLSQWNPHAIIISASLVHKLYGNKLRPFLKGAEHLSEDVMSVFPAADGLEQYIMAVITSSCEDDIVDDYCREKLKPYQIEPRSGELVSRWLNSQLVRVIEWVQRVIEQERWEPISAQQRHGYSIVEAYRIIEETVDQFFALRVPMRPSELNSLFRGVDNAFHVYTLGVVGKLVNKNELKPPVPILTRYKKEIGIKAFVKKEIIAPHLPDERISNYINILTTSNLCVRLNTLHYLISQLNKLEDGILERWEMARPRENFNIKRSDKERLRSSVSQNQKTTFDSSKKEINAAIDQICDFTATKIIFWDLRERFIDNLYKPGVTQSRMDILIEALDTELNQLCDVITEPLRDRVVAGLLQQAVEGLYRVLVDGGSSRVFFPSDSRFMEEDLEILKEFFISGGDGLPRGTVENMVSKIRPLIKLHSYESRVLIDDYKTASETQGSKTRSGEDANIILRILCHRSDSEASHYVKKYCKIPSASV